MLGTEFFPVDIWSKPFAYYISEFNCARGKETLRSSGPYNRWFSRYVIAAMLVDGKQKIAH